jgi:hypothetical protein
MFLKESVTIVREMPQRRNPTRALAGIFLQQRRLRAPQQTAMATSQAPHEASLYSPVIR